MKKEYNYGERLKLEEVKGGIWIDKLNVVLEFSIFLSKYVFVDFPESNSSRNI